MYQYPTTTASLNKARQHRKLVRIVNSKKQIEEQDKNERPRYPKCLTA